MKFPQKPLSKTNRTWTFLSLCALLALMTPQLLWACPMAMNAAGSTPGQACPCLPQSKSDADNFGAMKGCCEQVPLPSSDISNEDGLALFKSRAVFVDYDFPLTWSTPAPPPDLESVSFSKGPVTFPSPISSSLISQHSSRRHSGRAPPI